MGSSMKSIVEMKKLVNFLKSNDFKKDDLAAFNIHSETTKFDDYLEQPAGDNPQDGWRQYFTVPHIVRLDSGGVQWSPLSPVKVRWTPVEVQ